MVKYARITTLIDTDEILKVKNDVVTKITELDGMLDHVAEFLKNSKEYFDTESADYFREMVEKYISQEKIKLESDLLKYVKSLDVICSVYKSLNSSIKKEVDYIG